MKKTLKKVFSIFLTINIVFISFFSIIPHAEASTSITVFFKSPSNWSSAYVSFEYCGSNVNKMTYIGNNVFSFTTNKSFSWIYFNSTNSDWLHTERLNYAGPNMMYDYNESYWKPYYGSYGGTKTVYVYNGSGNTMYAYCWNGRKSEYSWPGNQMKYIGNGYYSYTVPELYTNIIFTDYYSQTYDLLIYGNNGKCFNYQNGYGYWATVNENKINNYQSASASEILDKLNFDPKSAIKDINLGSQNISALPVSVFGKEYNLLNFKTSTSIPIGSLNTTTIVDPNNKSIKILLGFKDSTNAEITSVDQKSQYWSESYQEVKSLYKKLTGNSVDTTKLWNDFSKLRGKLKKVNGNLGFSMDANIAGYFELDYSANTLKMKEGGIILSASAEANFTYYFVPCLVFANFKAGLGFDGKIYISYTDSGVIEPNFEAGIDSSIALSVGLGKRNGFLKTYIEGGVDGKLRFSYATDKSNPLSINLSANAFIKGAIAGFNIEGFSTTFYSKQLYPNYDKSLLKTVYKADSSILKNSTPLSRDYYFTPVESQNHLLKDNYGDDFEIDNLYPYNSPSVAILDNGTIIMVWIDDTGRKSDINRTSVMYSVYKNYSWSAPKEIHDIGTFNDSPNLIAKGNKAYLVWQRANSILDDTCTLEDLYTDMDLYYSEFDGSDFSIPISLADSTNYTFEMGGYLSVNENDNIIVLRVENSENNIFDNVGTNSIFMKERIDGEWNLSEEIYSTSDSIECIQATNQTIYFVVSEEQNKLYAYDKSSKTISLLETSDDIIMIQSVDNDLYYLLEGVLHCLDKNGNNSLIKENCGDDFCIISNGSYKSILCNRCTKEFQKELFISDYEDGNWSEWIQYTDYNSYIRSYSPVMDSEGNVITAINKVIIDKDNDENVFGEASLVVAKSCEYKDISLEYLTCNTDNYYAGDTVELNFAVNNYSSEDLSSFTANLYDENEILISSTNFTSVIKAFDKNEFTIDYTLPEEFKKSRLTLRIECGTENDYSNNCLTIILGYTDLVNSDSNIEITSNTSAVLTGKVCNKGIEKAKNTVINIYDENNNLLFKKDIGDISANEEYNYSIDIPDSIINSSEANDTNILYLSVIADNEEINTANNEDKLAYSSLKNVMSRITYNTGTEQTLEDDCVKNNSTISLPFVQQKGYYFDGWTDNSNNLYLSTSLLYADIYADTDFTAKWIKNGDVDENNKREIYDATYIQKMCCEMEDMAYKKFFLSDVDCNDKVNIKDVTLYQLYLADIIKEFPADNK
ncbi:starch-binding protein [uncultured Ruminococcus sp.]|uniref:starch-binding protein n=1 Tax=uncultured Ruminococcus sp. TaxID=165186 RepID=UPI0025EE051A|nr:starch-binding protein [uncultured Ruminococcus sp.]